MPFEKEIEPSSFNDVTEIFSAMVLIVVKLLASFVGPNKNEYTCMCNVQKLHGYFFEFQL
jgi:hypothetical protein